MTNTTTIELPIYKAFDFSKTLNKQKKKKRLKRNEKVNEMVYRIGSQYKLHLLNGLVFTGIILEEEEKQICIKTIKNEEIVLNKDDVRQARLLEEEKEVT